VYGLVDGLVLLSFTCSGFACGFNCMQAFLNIATAMVNRCDPVVSPRTGKRLGIPSREQQPETSHHRADVPPCIVE
jgi:hypothetical protein